MNNPAIILICTRKPELDELIKTQLTSSILAQGFDEKAVTIKTAYDDSEVLREINSSDNKPLMLIIKPNGSGTKGWSPVKAARDLKIITIVWTRHIHYKNACDGCGAIYVPIPSVKGGSRQSVSRVILASRASIQARVDDNALQHTAEI